MFHNAKLSARSREYVVVAVVDSNPRSSAGRAPRASSNYTLVAPVLSVSAIHSNSFYITLS